MKESNYHPFRFLFPILVFITGGIVNQCSGQAFTLARLADGFDYPVGKPDSYGYYVYRGFTQNGHLGEDWNGTGGGDSDLGDPRLQHRQRRRRIFGRL